MRVGKSGWAGLLWLVLYGPSAAAEKPAAPYLELHFKSEIRDELDLYALDRAIRKIRGVKKTEGSWRERRIRVEIAPDVPMPVAEVGRAVRASGHALREMVLECGGIYSREGYRSVFRSEPGGVLFQLAVGVKTRELENLPQPARLRLRGRVNLERLTSPFALVVLSYSLE